MINGLGVHGVDDTNVVCDLRLEWQDLAHPSSALALLFEFEWSSRKWKAGLVAAHRRETLALADGLGKFHSVFGAKCRFVVEEFKLLLEKKLE